MQFKRSWPIGETPEVLKRRWQALLGTRNRKLAFKETRDRVISRDYPKLEDPTQREPAIVGLQPGAPYPTLKRVAYRSFDRQWVLADNRLGDYLRPTLFHAHSERQVYMTSLLTDVLGAGPAAVAAAYIPDLHHFRNRGARDVIPLWRDAAASDANVTAGVLPALSAALGRPVSAADLFAYCYAILATPRYVAHFWDELTIPGPRIPISKDPALFGRAVALGRRLIWLHTYGERFAPPGAKAGRVPVGTARCQRGTPTTPAEYPESFAYDEAAQELRVGKGLFSGVRPQVWAFSISGLDVVKSWLAYRMRQRAGRKSSPLDDIRPETWEFDEELLQLLWVLDATVDMLPEVGQTLGEVLAGPLCVAGDFPQPSDRERRGPKGPASDLPLFDLAGISVNDVGGADEEDEEVDG